MTIFNGIFIGLIMLFSPLAAFGGEQKMMAKGEFEVKMAPQSDEGFEAGRLTLDKSYTGDLEATSRGQMLSVMTKTQGSAGYVAIETVTGTLMGKTGTFSLQHSGVMNRGEQSLTLFVIPDSGTDELEGLSGDMKIIIEDGKHFYEFEFEIK